MKLFEINYTSPSGSPVTTYFETEQGSKYLLSGKGESKRLKSVHANTGGEDAGLKQWMQRCIFVPEQFQYEANAVQMLVHKVGRLSNIYMSIKDDTAALYQKGSDGWKVLTWDDAYPKSQRGPKPLAFKFAVRPEVGMHALEFSVDNTHALTTYHFGSKVSKVAPFSSLQPSDIEQFKTKVSA